MHVKSEYDYMFESQFRKEIFDAMKWVFFNENKANLPVYGVPDNLKDYHTSKKDISNGLEVNPQEQFRIKGEDVYSEQAIKVTKTEVPNDAGFDEINAWNQEFVKARSDTMFQRNKNEKKADLKDFQIKSVIGRGSFGKVFLVQKV